MLLRTLRSKHSLSDFVLSLLRTLRPKDSLSEILHFASENSQIQAKSKTWFESIVAIYKIALNWSLESVILSKVTSLSEGLDSDFEQDLELRFHATPDIAPTSSRTFPRFIVYVQRTVYLRQWSQERAGDEDEDDDDLPPEQVGRPKTKKELGEVQSKFKNKVGLATHYYEDDLLRLEMKVIFWGTYHVMKEFSQTLKQHKQGQVGRATDVQGNLSNWGL